MTITSCPECNGGGRTGPAADAPACPQCKGTGRLVVPSGPATPHAKTLAHDTVRISEVLSRKAIQ
jgi:DnaJ-class molecular chaperone